MDELVDAVGLQSLLEESGETWRGEGFEALYDKLSTSGKHTALVHQLEQAIWQYFDTLTLPQGPTIYDYLLLTLRKKDLIATFNWDPFLAEAYQRNSQLRELPAIVFLHGNVRAGLCEKDRVKGWLATRCEKCGSWLEATPLLYPVRDKDYRKNPFIASEWAQLEEFLQRAYFLTIFGYRAPKTDAAARQLLSRIWKTNPSKELAEVEIINIRSREELHASWQEFITREHYLTTDTFFRSYQSWHPRRSCDALAGATLLCDPWRDDWLPQFETLGELQAWIGPLLQEEVADRKNGTGFSRLPCQEISEENIGGCGNAT